MVGLLSKVLVKASEATKKKTASLVTLKRRDLRAVLKLFYQEGWVDFTLADLEYMFAMSPKTCFKFMCDGEMIGATFALKLANGVCYPNSSIIAEKYRKTVKYHEEVLQYAAYLKEIAAYEVTYSAKWLEDIYRDTMGYQTQATIARYQVLPADVDQAQPAGAEPIQYLDLDSANLQPIADYLEGIYHSERLSLLKHGLNNGFVGCALQVDGNIAGFIMRRELPKHIQIGPLIADSDELAQHLLSHMLQNVKGEGDKPVLMDIYQDKAPVLAEAKGIRWIPDGTHMVKMTRGDQGYREQEQFIYSIYSHYLS